MLRFSSQPSEAQREMEGVLFYLTAFGYIDGHFDHRERAYIKEFIGRLADTQFKGDHSDEAMSARNDLVMHLMKVFERVDAELASMWDEPTAEGEDSQDFVRSRVKLRCFEIFESFPSRDRKLLLGAVDNLLVADGIAHPEEVKFRTELIELLDSERRRPDKPVERPQEAPRGQRVVVHDPSDAPRTHRNHPALTGIEHHYSSDPRERHRQLTDDVGLIDKVIGFLDDKRHHDNGLLDGYQTVQQLAGQPDFLDDHVYVIPPTHEAGYELLVLGDLHGCYSCLKGALMQFDFIGKLNRYQKSPDSNPLPLLVLLGDYIDRGRFSYHGVLRAVLNLVLAAPGHVIPLRGNHEYYIEHDHQIISGVRPAEAINKLKPHAPDTVFEAYRDLFDALPNMLLFDDMLFVHAGIPRDSTIRERYRDLASLNDPVIRFQMMWSDPSSADVVPEELQEASNRFAFGREQARDFLHRMGVQTLIRGHEKVLAGVAEVYDDPDLHLLTLFSAGGANNDDLPPRSGYRAVTPAALTIRHARGQVDIEPWVIDYESYNQAELNEFFNSDPELF